MTSEGNEFWEEQFERWASKAGITAPKLRHSVFKDTVFGDLRYGEVAFVIGCKVQTKIAVGRDEMRLCCLVQEVVGSTINI